MVLPEIRLLQAAIAVAEDLHFSRAADRLNMSQSTLSKQILKLEHDIGFRLFEHNHQAAELTDAGRVFIAEAREVVAHAERAILSARAIADGPVEVLNIGNRERGHRLYGVHRNRLSRTRNSSIPSRQGG